MKTEVSSGGLVVKKQGSSYQILLLKDKNEVWSFPKGLIEAGENNLQAAQREIGEETGIKSLKLIKDLSSIKYWYKWQGELVHKTVYFFLFETLGNEIAKPQTDEGISEVKWFTFDEVLKIIGYRKTNEKILKEAIYEMVSGARH